MVNRNLIRALEDDEIIGEVDALFGVENEIDWLPPDDPDLNFSLNKIVKGTIIRVDDDFVVIDVGFKSEGSVARYEWADHQDQPEVGGQVQVLIEELEDETGASKDLIAFSKKRADDILNWEKIIEGLNEGDIVTGQVIRKIKGGLLVDIDVNVFLPASQVDIRRPGDIGDYIGRTVQCEILKIDEQRRNIVVSRRSLIESERKYIREILLKELEEGQIRTGIVKNIADFGAFVDLGGIDGLLHITDMSHTRISHPSEMVSIDEEIDVKILKIDHENEKIALGMKQMQPNPWENVEEKYPVGTTHKGEVVNVMSYGAFVKLEPGIEGLVHISEMSWVKRINHPNEVVQIGDEIEVAILGVDHKGEQMSLGMKQTQDNPWDKVAEKYPLEGDVKGRVRNLTNYGAFIELEEGIDGLLHVSDMSWTRKISHPNELLEKGQEIDCKILAVDQDRRRIALGLKQMDADPWTGEIPEKYQPGQLIKSTVTKITNFGVFISLENELEGLLHISELADHKVENPEEIVKVGDELEVKVLRVDIEERKIGLSRKRVEWSAEEEAAAAAEQSKEEAANAPKQAPGDLKGGIGGGGLLIPDSVVTPDAPAETVKDAAEAPTETVADATEESESDDSA